LRPAFDALLDLYELAGARVQLINQSENTTLLVQPTHGGTAVILRIYRPMQRSDAEIHSELDWMEALRLEAKITTPRAIRTRQGQRISKLHLPGVPLRSCVVFERLPGHEPLADSLLSWFEQLGMLSARIHLHGRHWTRPANFTRPRLDYDALIGPDAVWGSWEHLSALDPPAIALLRKVSRCIAERLEDYGCHSDRFGLIHGDLRLANLLVEGSLIHVIDFDDCAISWYLYDLSTSISLLEHLPEAGTLIDKWLSGYQRTIPLSTQHLDMVPHLIMMRRIQVLSWFAGHAEPQLTAEYLPIVLPATIAAGARYLRAGPKGDPDL